MAALARQQTRDLRQAAGHDRGGSTRALRCGGSSAGVVNAVTFNYRGNPLVQQARAMVADGEIGDGALHSRQRISRTGCCSRYGFFVAPRARERRRELSDWRHRIALVRPCSARRRPAHRRGARRSDAPSFRRGYNPTASTEAFARAEAGDRSRVTVRSEDLATVLVRFSGGAKGCVSVGQVCAGHKNDLWFEMNGRRASIRWVQERQNELWIGRRTRPTRCWRRIRRSLLPPARTCTPICQADIRKAGPTRSATCCGTFTRSLQTAAAQRIQNHRHSQHSKTDIMRRWSWTPSSRAIGAEVSGPKWSGAWWE